MFALAVAPALFNGPAPEFVAALPGLSLDDVLGRPAREPLRDYPLVETSGTIELRGDEVLVIDREHRVHRGDIILRDRAQLVIRGATLDHESSADIDGSPDLFIELVWSDGVTVDEALPSKIGDEVYAFPNEGEFGITLRLTARRAHASNWGITMRAANDVTLRDTDHVTVTIAVGEPWVDETVELEGLREQRYADQTWQVVDSTLRLVNTGANKWSPIVGTSNTLIMRDSDLADQAFSWGDGRVVIEHSSLSTVRARDQVQITVRDSSVDGDVVAQDDGRIVLERTRVGGAVVEQDRGTVQVID